MKNGKKGLPMTGSDTPGSIEKVIKNTYWYETGCTRVKGPGSTNLTPLRRPDVFLKRIVPTTTDLDESRGTSPDSSSPFRSTESPTYQFFASLSSVLLRIRHSFVFHIHFLEYFTPFSMNRICLISSTDRHLLSVPVPSLSKNNYHQGNAPL